MTTEELGKALAEARTARSLTLHDVERDTRISRKYLQALEEGNLDVLPAPVYARAFMRTYAQYLGLNASSFVQHLPGAKPEADLPALPQFGRESTTAAMSASWLIAGVVIALLVGLGALLFWDRGGEQTTADALSGSTLGSEQPTPPFGQSITVEPGIVPDVTSRPLQVAMTALDQAQLAYFIIEVTNPDVAAGIVFQQSPAAGTPGGEDTVVTLTVSR